VGAAIFRRPYPVAALRPVDIDQLLVYYDRDRDKGKLAANYAGFFRAIFMPSLASALAPERGGEGRERLQQRLAEEPASLNLRAQTIVLAKVAEA
jgi:hypothetical protein